MNMDLCNTQLLFSTNSEQAIELDYVLPDYCPDIFKVLKSKICTRILSYRLEGNKIEIDGINILTILYLGEENNRMRQLEQRLVFTKNIDLQEEYIDSHIKIKSKTNYLNCKVQNSRKIDIRGAVNLEINLYGNKSLQINTDLEEIQTHQQMQTILAPMLYTAKSFSTKEQLEVGAGKMPIQDIISYEAYAKPVSYKLLANKAICKGELVLHTVYLGGKDLNKPEWIEHTVPISRIVDFDDIDEDYTLDFHFEVTKYDIDLQVDENGDCRIFTAEVGLRICLEASKNISIQLTDDCYSTKYETDVQKSNVTLERMEKSINETIMLTNQVTLTDIELSEISHASAEITNMVISSSEITFSIKIYLLLIDKDGVPSLIEENFSSEYSLKDSFSEDILATLKMNLQSYVKSISYHMINASVCELRSEVNITGIAYSSFNTDIILELKVDETKEKPVDKTSAIKVYFTQEDETLWDIAKKYSTTITEIIEYNTIESPLEGVGERVLDQKLKFREVILLPPSR